MARESLAKLRQYIEDFEVSSTRRLDALEVRLASMETEFAIIKECLFPRKRDSGTESGPEAPVQREAEEAAPPGEPRIDPRFVAARLGLTRAQGEVAVLLARGHRVRDIAAATRRQSTTVRWHLKEINRKLNIQRQSQLVSLVLLLPHRSDD